jgi:hypothetical protein
MTPISTAASSYGRVASGAPSPERPPPEAPAAPASSTPVQRPSAVVSISPEARERAESAERAAQTRAQDETEASPRAQAATQAAQNAYAQVAAAQNAGDTDSAPA